MAINGITVGKDMTVTLNNNSGNIVTTRVKNFQAKQKTENKSSVALDGVNRHLNIPMGWEGSFEAERTGPELDALIQNFENQYYSGQQVQLIAMTQTINEADGTVTQHQFAGCVIQMESSGEYKGDDYVTQKISFSASTRDAQA